MKRKLENESFLRKKKKERTKKDQISFSDVSSRAKIKFVRKKVEISKGKNRKKDKLIESVKKSLGSHKNLREVPAPYTTALSR